MVETNVYKQNYHKKIILFIYYTVHVELEIRYYNTEMSVKNVKTRNYFYFSKLGPIV